MFYVLIWIIVWFRWFSFFNALLNITQTSTNLEIITRLIDVLLMVITAIMILKGLGAKVYDSMIFNSNNMPFFLFSFTLLYIEGQIILITGAGNLTGFFSDRNQINLINNFLIILITVSFYWWYSESSLERKGFIVKSRFYPEEVALLIRDFKDFLVTLNALDTNKIGDNEVQNFLDANKIKTEDIDVPTETPLETKTEVKSENSEEEISKIDDTTNDTNV